MGAKFAENFDTSENPTFYSGVAWAISTGFLISSSRAPSLPSFRNSPWGYQDMFATGVVVAAATRRMMVIFTLSSDGDRQSNDDNVGSNDDDDAGFNDMSIMLRNSTKGCGLHRCAYEV